MYLFPIILLFFQNCNGISQYDVNLFICILVPYIGFLIAIKSNLPKKTKISILIILIIILGGFLYYFRSNHFFLELILPLLSLIVSYFIGYQFFLNKLSIREKFEILKNEKKLFDMDLKLARNIQESLFPKLNQIPGMKYEVFRQTHNQLGGDFFDFVRLREGNAGVFMTDVAGHGISSAMVAAMLKVVISTIPYTFKLDPSAFLTYLDEKMVSEYSSEHATAIYIYLNFLRNEISIANGGHPYIIYQKAGKNFEEIETEGALIGYGIRKPLADSIQFNYSKGDRFFIYTDGLIENSGEDELGSEGLTNILNELKDNPIKELKSLLIQEIALYYKKTDFTDDAMFILAELE